MLISDFLPRTLLRPSFSETASRRLFPARLLVMCVLLLAYQFVPYRPVHSTSFSAKPLQLNKDCGISGSVNRLWLGIRWSVFHPDNTPTHSAPDLSITHRAQPIREPSDKGNPCAFHSRGDVRQTKQDLLLAELKQRLSFCNFRRFERSSQCLESIVVTGSANRILDIQIDI